MVILIVVSVIVAAVLIVWRASKKATGEHSVGVSVSL